MAGPIFPSLLPKQADSLWFNVDKPCDDDNEIKKMEDEYQTWLVNIAERDSDVVPIGKSSAENPGDDDEDDDDEDGDVDDDSESNEDAELDTDMYDERDSPDEAEMEGNEPASDTPSWAS